MALKIKKVDVEKIFQHARKCHPNEACGILAGRTNGAVKVIEKVYHVKNVLASPSAYQIDPVEQLKVFEEVELNGLEVVGFYHSHPFWDSFWSDIDEAKSKLWTGYSFLIISLKTGKINSYLKKKEGADEEEIILQ